MQLVDILLDNRISCPFINAPGVENVIFCRPLEESLDNVSVIATKDSEFIHNYLEESTGNYLVTNVALEDGSVYEGVRFKLVTVEEGKELPTSTINLSSLGTPSSTDVIPPAQLIEEEYNHIPESIEEKDDFNVLYNVPEVIDNTEIVQKVKALESKLVTEQQKLEQEKVKLNKERTILEADRKLQKTLDDYKSELLQETFRINDHQKTLLEKAVIDLNNSLQEQFDGQQINVNKYLDTLGRANLLEVKKYQDDRIELIKEEIHNLLTERLKDNSVETDKLLLERAATLEALFTEKLITELESHKRNVGNELTTITNTLDGIVDQRLKENNDEVDKLLVTRSGILLEQVTESVADQLDKHKTGLFDEFKTVSTNTATELFEARTKELNTALELVIDEHRKNLNTTIDQKLNEVSSSVSKFTTDIEGKLPQLDETIKDINKRIQTLVIEKKNVQALADDARKYTDTKVAQASEEMMNYARRILDLGGGGGSVAVQYAEGGTMNGSLNVTGQYLSGGVDISTLFGRGGGTNNSPYTNGSDIGAIVPVSGSNVTSGVYSNIGGGTGNAILSSGAYSAIVGGFSNTASGNFSNVAGGCGNNASGNYSAILGGHINGDCGFSNVFILGSNINATQANTTFANSLILLNGTCDQNNSPTYGCATAKIIYGAPGESGYSGSQPGAGGCINVSGGIADDSGGIGGNGGSINMSGGSGSDASTGGNGGIISLGGARGNTPYAGGSAGSIISDGASFLDGYYANGGSLTMSAGYNCSGGSINTSAGGGSINTTGSGYIQLGTASAYTMTQLQGTASDCNKTIYLPNANGTIALNYNPVAICAPAFCSTQSTYDDGNPSPAAPGAIYLNGGGGQGNSPGNGGCLFLTGGNANNGCGGNAGSIYLQGGTPVDNATAGNAGSICLYGGYAFGYQTGSGYHSNGGSILSYGGIVSDSNTSCNASGGTLNMSGGTDVPGGSIITCNGGGCVNTTGSGYIGLGDCYTNQQTALLGTVSSGYNQILCFPDTSGVGGTIALTSDFVYCRGSGTNSIQPKFLNNNASGNYSNVAGGSGNTASGNYSNVAGGCCNTASGAYSTIAGGYNNSLSGNNTFIAGGSGNTSGFNNTFIIGQGITASQSNFTYVNNISSQGLVYDATGNSNQWNTAYSLYTYVNSTSATNNPTYNTSTFAKLSAQVYQAGTGSSSIKPINGGYNTASGNYSNVAGGYFNNASGDYSNVAGGEFNNASGYISNVAGGYCNNASGNYSNVAGGRCNNASGNYSNVAGGCNTASGLYSNVAGGRCNNASGNYSSILGGNNNNTNNKACSFIIGQGITASQPNYTYVNNLSSQGTITTASIAINQTPMTFVNPATASGTFLILNINGVNKALQLWDYTS